MLPGLISNEPDHVGHSFFGLAMGQAMSLDLIYEFLL